MKRTLLVAGFTLAMCLPAHADISHKIQSSVSLAVDGAASVAIRQPSSLAVSGSNVTLDTTPALGTLTSGTALGYTPGAFSITMLVTAFRIQKHTLKETTFQASSQQQSPTE